VYRAAWTIDEGEPTASADASMAKAAASDAATLAARVALQVHGAIGYTWEHDLHLWMKRAWVLGAAWGDAPWHRARLLELLASP
ncbi:MAG TPA: acyl-CoA dehydrogenase family protein, partial [Acidimicrobiales bacterium]|nr:acyl-CoA dehydrogenase family protein [Acidimicrobiales bacterium]